MEYNVKDAIWFSGRDVIGIVLVDTGFGHKAYIGCTPGEYSGNEVSDAQYIASCGARFHHANKLWLSITDWAD